LAGVPRVDYFLLSKKTPGLHFAKRKMKIKVAIFIPKTTPAKTFALFFVHNKHFSGRRESSLTQPARPLSLNTLNN